MKLRQLIGPCLGLAFSLSLATAQERGDVELLAWWDFNDSDSADVATDVVNGIQGEIRVATYAEGRTGAGDFAMDFSESGSTVAIVGTEATQAGFLNKGGARDQLTFVFWQKWDEPIRNSSAFWSRADGMDRAAQVHTPWGNGSVYFDSTGGCCDAATQRTFTDASDLPWEDEWIHFSFVKDGPNKYLYANGELIIENENTGEFNEAFQDLFIGSAVDGGNNFGGRIDDFAVFAGALSEDQVQTLADPSSSILTIIDNSNPGINLNEGQGLNGGSLPALSGDQEISFTLKNTIKSDEPGATALTISAVDITDGDTENFSLVSTFPKTLEPNATDQLVLNFNNRGQFGAFSVDLNVKSNDADTEDQDINITVNVGVVNPVGPIAHYRLDESSAESGASDATGNGRIGEYRNNTGSITLGQAGLKDGSGTSAAFTGGGALTVAGLPDNQLQSFTLSLWMTPASLGDIANSDFRTVIAKGLDNPSFGLLEGSGELIWFGDADGVADALLFTEGLGLEAGTTYHVVQRYDHTTQTASIWVDGSEAVSGDVPLFEDIGNFYAGAFGEGALPFEGTLDDIQLYDMALTPDQVTYLMNNPGQPLVPVGEVDTDLDGLSDDAEANTHNTNPLVADTDGDGLTDGEEVNDTMTDPLVADTDGDGNNDGVEQRFGSNPRDVDSTLGTFLVRTIQGGSDVDFTTMDAFKEALADRAQISAENVSNFTYINFRDNAQGNFPEDELPFPLWDTFGARDQFGVYVTGKINITQAGPRTFGVNSDDGFELNIDGQLVAEFTDPRGSADTFGTIDLTEGEHTLELFYYERGGGAQVELFVNTALGAVESFNDGNFVLLPAFGDAVADDDGDGLNNFWEEGFFGNNDQGPDDDPDSDGLNNLAELDAGTDPTVADTDGDGINDGSETDTDPTVADTDKDGLNDGDELAAGTDPNNRDTDNDGLGDGFEVIKGTDPLVADGGGGNPFDLRAAWEFNTVPAGESVVDDSNGILGLLQDGAVVAAEGGQSGEAGDGALDLNNGTSMKVEEVTFYNDVAANDVITLVFWQKLTETTNQTTFKAQSPSSNGSERGFSVHTPWSGNDSIFFDTAGCCDGTTQRMNKETPAGLDYTDGWHHFGFVKNGTTKQIWVDGELHHEATNTSPLPTDHTALWIGSAIDGSESTVGWLDDIAIFAQALNETAMKSLADGTRPTQLGAGGGGGGDNPHLLLALWDFNDSDSTDVAVDGFGGALGTIQGGAYTADGGGRTGQAGDTAFDGSTGQVIVDGPNVAFMNEAQAVDKVTFSFWQNLNSVVSSSSFWATATGAGGDRAAQAHVSWGDGNYYFDTAGCCDGATQRLSGPAPEGYAEGWHHYAFVKDGPNKAIWLDGVNVLEGENTAPLPEGFTALYISGADNGASLVDGLIDEFAVFASALPEEAIVALAQGTRPDQLSGGDPGGDPGGNTDRPTIGSVVAGPSSLGISFTGEAGKTYAIEYSPDLQTWSVIQSGLSGAITYEDTDASRIDSPEGYYRAIEN